MTDEDRPDAYRATLVRAAQILGGVPALSRRLQVPMLDVKRWLAGAQKPSMGIFLKVIDILIEEGKTSGERGQLRADRSQDKADRSQARADRSQARADRDQAKADRSQAEADRDQESAGRKQDHAGNTRHPSDTKAGPLRLVQREDGEPASDTPDEEAGKTSAG